MNFPDADLWAITCFFNPAGYRSRLANYHTFRRNLAVPLATVELAYGNRFELQKDDAEILIQIKGKDVLWQKERLLNVALDSLPKGCEKFVWLDCDILFSGNDWPVQAIEALEDYPMVHLFSERYNLSRKARIESLGNPPSGSSIPSLLELLAQGNASPDDFYSDAPLKARPSTVGVAWAGRRAVFEAIGFYDSCVLGGGDRAMLLAALGCPDRFAKDARMLRSWKRHYLAWAKRFFKCVRGNVGHIRGIVYHLRHGEVQQRDYRNRYRVLRHFNFYPERDIRISESGAWRWNSSKPEMHQAVRDYFLFRKEDG